MSAKTIGLGGAVVIALLPFVALVAVATLIVPSAAGSAGRSAGCHASGRCARAPSITDLPAGFAGAFISAAAKEIGMPYVWGGGSFAGPTSGGFDCSGLVLYAAYMASGGRLRLPHFTGDQVQAGQPVEWAQRRPGDLIFFTYPGAMTPHHVAIYLGGDQILQAPRAGEVVRYGTLGEFAGQVMTVRRLG